jgi:hypothetical protein
MRSLWAAMLVAWPGLGMAAQSACTPTVDVVWAHYTGFYAQFEAAGKRFRVDPDLGRAVTMVESRFDPLAVSPKGARGLMQIMPGTGLHLGVRDPLNASDSIFGGMQYLHEIANDPRYIGKPYLTLVAYNAGPNRSSFPPESYHYADLVTAIYWQLKKAQHLATGLIAPTRPINAYLSAPRCASTHTVSTKPRFNTGGRLIPTRHY